MVGTISAPLIFRVALLEEETLAGWKAGSGQHLAELGSSPGGGWKWQLSPCGWGIWLSAAPKSPTWNALCISLEGSQTLLWKLQLVASHKQHPALTSGCYVMLFMDLFQVMEFHCLSGALATGSTYIFSALWFFPLNCTNLYIWASALETFLLCIYSAVQVLRERKNKYVLLGKLGGESKGSRDSGKQNLVFTDGKSVYLYCLSVPVLYWLVRGSKIPFILHPQLWQLLPTSAWTHICLWLSWETEDVMWKSFLTLLHSYMLIGMEQINLRLQMASLTAADLMIWNDRIFMVGKHLWDPAVNPAPPNHIPKCHIHPQVLNTSSTIMLCLMWEQRARAGSIGSGWLITSSLGWCIACSHPHALPSWAESCWAACTGIW